MAKKQVRLKEMTIIELNIARSLLIMNEPNKSWFDDMVIHEVLKEFNKRHDGGIKDERTPSPEPGNEPASIPAVTIPEPTNTPSPDPTLPLPEPGPTISEPPTRDESDPTNQ